jgi:hypothetical protein
MSDNEQSPPAEERTTVLHLGKILSEEGVAAPAPPASDDTVTILIKKVATQAAQESPKPLVVPKGPAEAVPPAQMLGAVAYAYSKGVYRSEEIEDKMFRDPAVRAALGEEIPDARSIRRFRYLNREAILATLEKFYFWRRKAPTGKPLQCGLPPATESTAGNSEGNSTLVVKKQAAEKLDEAASVDNMLKEQ